MIKTMTTSIFQNMGDALAFIVAWIAYLAIRFLEWVGENFLSEIPFFGRALAWLSSHLLGWLKGPAFDLAAALTLGLLANLIWDMLAARRHWKSPDPSKSTLVPAPGPLNWVVAAGFFLLFTRLRAIGNSIGEFLYWSSWWEIALAILAIILVLVAIVVIVALILRWRGLGGRRRRRRRR